MTNQQRYIKLLESIADLISEKEEIIQLREYEIQQLKAKLNEAEEKLED